MAQGRLQTPSVQDDFLLQMLQVNELYLFLCNVHLFASILTLRLANRSKFLKRLHCCSMTELNVLKNKVLDSKYRHLFLALGFVTVIGKTFPQQCFHGLFITLQSG